MKNTDIAQKTQTCCNFVHVRVILQISLTHNKLKWYVLCEINLI